MAKVPHVLCCWVVSLGCPVSTYSPLVLEFQFLRPKTLRRIVGGTMRNSFREVEWRRSLSNDDNEFRRWMGPPCVIVTSQLIPAGFFVPVGYRLITCAYSVCLYAQWHGQTWYWGLKPPKSKLASIWPWAPWFHLAVGALQQLCNGMQTDSDGVPLTLSISPPNLLHVWTKYPGYTCDMRRLCRIATVSLRVPIGLGYFVISIKKVKRYSWVIICQEGVAMFGEWCHSKNIGVEKRMTENLIGGQHSDMNWINTEENKKQTGRAKWREEDSFVMQPILGSIMVTEQNRIFEFASLIFRRL